MKGPGGIGIISLTHGSQGVWNWTSHACIYVAAPETHGTVGKLEMMGKTSPIQAGAPSFKFALLSLLPIVHPK